MWGGSTNGVWREGGGVRSGGISGGYTVVSHGLFLRMKGTRDLGGRMVEGSRARVSGSDCTTVTVCRRSTLLSLHPRLPPLPVRYHFCRRKALCRCSFVWFCRCACIRFVSVYSVVRDPFDGGLLILAIPALGPKLGDCPLVLEDSRRENTETLIYPLKSPRRCVL